MDFVSTTPDDRRRCRVLDIPVDACRDVRAAALGLHARGGGRIVTLNAEMTMTARANPELRGAIASAELVIPDGAGVVWALSRQGVKVVRSPGIELAWTLLSYAAAHQWRVALIGASPEVMSALQQNLPDQLPGLNLVMAVHGYQPEETWPGLESQLLGLQPDLILIALGVPRQETWSQAIGSGVAGLWMGVGGSFDVWAGVKTRAPSWMGRFQIEWLYRLIQEPSRWRRMLSLPQFVWEVIRKGERATR
jgi:N-acetylglucosaminyldiphosphoundecaprenol N-acetyl-beta-D-mannosaminyltransferase